MIAKLLYTILIFTLFNLAVYSQGIKIDHTCTNIEQIPLNIIDSVKQNMKFQWCGQSHSHQIPSGLNLLEIENQIFDVTVGEVELPDPNGSFSVMDGLSLFNQCGNCCNAYIFPHEYWSGPNAFGNLEQTFIECYPTINISGFLWCGECESGSSEYVQAYLDSLSVYEERYPDIHFIYTTNHAQTSGPLGYNRYLRNEQIRQYCKANNKVLFDFADLDSWYNGEFNYYIYEGDTVPLQHPQFNPDIIHHTTEESCKIKARAIWYLMAKLSGWDHGITLDVMVNLEGSFNGIDMNNNLNDLESIPLSQPFNTFPWNYTGNENVAVIPHENVVDWILIELRDANQVEDALAETIVGVKAGFVLNDGTITDIDGVSSLSFDITINENLYIVVRHIRHLDIISSNPANIAGNTYVYDFTISELQAFGGAAGQKEISPGIWGMISGDGNADGIINIDDKNTTWLNQSGKSGYYSADYNMGGKVDNQDKNEEWLNNIGKETQVPD